jgi:tripartite-type tricarboxylate transporter receptor subunit TctC
MILSSLPLRSRGNFLANAIMPAFVSLIALLCSAISVLAQTASSYPAEPIRIIVPFGPASGPDFAVRALQQVLQETIKQSVRVENRPGANSIIGTRAVATAAPDGYTLLGASTGFSTIEITTSQPGFDPLKDFAPVSLTARGAGYLLVVSSKSPFTTMADLVAGAKKSEVFYGSPGIGNTLHLVAALFAEKAGGTFKHVPYPGVADAVLATARGEVGFAFATPPAVIGLLQSGELRAIGYAGSEPLPEMPTVPLVSSFAREFRIAEPWSGILAPAKTPGPVITVLNSALRRATEIPRYKTLLEPGSYRPYSSSPEEFRSFLEQNISDWRAAAQAAGIKAK